MRYYKVQTVAGSTEDVSCDHCDETAQEYRFIYEDKAPRIFQKANVISFQQYDPPSPEEWNRMVHNSQLGEPTYEPEELN